MSYRQSSYSNDPRWITARFNSACANSTTPANREPCPNTIKRGGSILYYPSSKTVYCGECSSEAWAEFESARFDEDQMTSQFM